jgi:hypothetical protein
MAFAQLTHRESLRDITSCLDAMHPKLYHMGIRSNVSRSNLSNANNVRDWRIFADFAQILIGREKQLYASQPLDIDLDATVYSLDSTTIDLCLTIFPWATFRRTKSAVKVHTLMNRHVPSGRRRLRGPRRFALLGSRLLAPLEDSVCYRATRPALIPSRRLRRIALDQIEDRPFDSSSDPVRIS